MDESIPVGSRWVLPDGRRVTVTSNPYWITGHLVTVFVENRRKGGRRTSRFTASRFLAIAKPYVPEAPK